MVGLPHLKADTLDYRTWSRMNFSIVPSWCYSMTLPRVFLFENYLLAYHPLGIQKKNKKQWTHEESRPRIHIPV